MGRDEIDHENIWWLCDVRDGLRYIFSVRCLNSQALMLLFIYHLKQTELSLRIGKKVGELWENQRFWFGPSLYTSSDKIMASHLNSPIPRPQIYDRLWPPALSLGMSNITCPSTHCPLTSQSLLYARMKQSPRPTCPRLWIWRYQASKQRRS